MRQTTGTRKSPGEKIVKDIKRATRKLGHHRLPDRDAQTQHSRSLRISGRHAHSHHLRPQTKPDKSSSTLELRQIGGSGAPLTVKPHKLRSQWRGYEDSPKCRSKTPPLLQVRRSNAPLLAFAGRLRPTTFVAEILDWKKKTAPDLVEEFQNSGAVLGRSGLLTGWRITR